MQIRFPSEEIIEYVASFEEIQQKIAKDKDIPINHQLFVCDHKIVSASFFKEDNLGDKPIDLMIKTDTKYAVCSIQLEEIAIENGFVPLIPPISLRVNRTLDSINFTPRFYNNNYVYANNKEEKERMINKTKPFYEKYNFNKIKRLQKIRALCEHLNTNTFVISTFNEPYIILFQNFIASCDKNGINIREKAILFPMDAPSYKACLDLDVVAYFEEGVYGPTTNIHGDYGDANFRICMFMKNAIIQDMMELGFDLLFQDIDMVWLNNPIPYLEQLADLKKQDYLFMFDGQNPRFQPLYYNSGFCYIQNNDFSRYTWQVIFDHYDMVWRYGSQQVPVNIVLNSFREQGLRTDLLDEYKFLNGHNIRPDNKNITNIKDETFVVHVSWTGNLTYKLMKLKENDLWYLD